MKKGMAKRILIISLIGVFLLLATACGSNLLDKARFDVQLSCGYGNSVEMGAYAPFYVEIENHGEDFEGTIQMIIPGRNNQNVMYEKDISLQKGATKTIELVGMIEKPTRQVNIRVANSKGKVIWSSLENCATLADLRNVNVGILSDDFSALGYMDHKPFSSNSEMTTQIFELTKDSFPSDWRALDMLDVIVISDYSTDMLSAEQLNALALWVNDGGLLMVGTGSTSNKTLSSLNDVFFNVKIGELEDYNTKYGLSMASFSYNYGAEDYYYSAYDDTLYTAFYEQNYESMKEQLQEEYMDEFQEYYGFDPNYDVWDQYWDESFYWFCFDEYYEAYLESLGEDTGGNSQKVAEMPFVNADVLELSGGMIDDDNTEVYVGETSGGQTYELAYIIEQGNGHLLLSGVDFTKTPLSNYEGNSMLFMHWVESIIGEACYNESMNYSEYNYGYYNPYDISYDEEEIYNGVASATVPPVLIYALIILLYMIAILVIYLVLRHKQKTMKLWILYPAIAGGLAVLIFCIGFSTRIYRPVVSAITLITPNGSASIQKSYTGVTVPGNKDYEVGFSSSQAVEYMNLDYSYYYYDEDEIDWDSYSISYKYGYDSLDVSLGAREAMSTAYFMLTSVVPEQRNIVIETDEYMNDITVTNDYGCSLEKAALIVDGTVYLIGDMTNGQTVEFSDMDKVTDMHLYSDGLGQILMQDESWKSLLGLAFGSVSGTYDDYLCRVRALNSITEYADRYEGPEIIFVALPSEETATPLQGATDYNERRVEIIYVEYDLPGVGTSW